MRNQIDPAMFSLVFETLTLKHLQIKSQTLPDLNNLLEKLTLCDETALYCATRSTPELI